MRRLTILLALPFAVGTAMASQFFYTGHVDLDNVRYIYQFVVYDEDISPLLLCRSGSVSEPWSIDGMAALTSNPRRHRVLIDGNEYVFHSGAVVFVHDERYFTVMNTDRWAPKDVQIEDNTAVKRVVSEIVRRMLARRSKDEGGGADPE